MKDKKNIEETFGFQNNNILDKIYINKNSKKSWNKQIIKDNF